MELLARRRLLIAPYLTSSVDALSTDAREQFNLSARVARDGNALCVSLSAYLARIAYKRMALSETGKSSNHSSMIAKRLSSRMLGVMFSLFLLRV